MIRFEVNRPAATCERRIYREILTVDVPTTLARYWRETAARARGVPLVEILQSQTGSKTVNQ